MLRQLFKSPETRARRIAAMSNMAQPIAYSNTARSQTDNNSLCRAIPTRHVTGHRATNLTANQIVSKSNPVQRLARELAKPGYHPSPITLGSHDDPYRADERILATTRQLLELLLKHQHPVHIITKSHLIVKDLDILSELARQRLCTVEVGVNTLNGELGGKIEPRTASPAARIKAIARLSQGAIPVGVMVAPVIPVVNDGELEALLRTIKEAGALTAGYQYLQLPADAARGFNHWLQQHFPDQAQRIFSLGQVNRNSSASEFAAMVHQRFQQTCLGLGLNRTGLPVLDTTRFTATVQGPPQPSAQGATGCALFSKRGCTGRKKAFF